MRWKDVQAQFERLEERGERDSFELNGNLRRAQWMLKQLEKSINGIEREGKRGSCSEMEMQFNFVV